MPAVVSRRVVLAATFTADPILGVLQQWADGIGLDATFSVAPFDNVFQTILLDDPDDGAAPGPVRVLMVRLSDWCRIADQGAAPVQDDHRMRVLAGQADSFIHALTTRVGRAGSPGTWIVTVCPSLDLEYTAPLDSFVVGIVEMIRLALARCPAVHWVDTTGLRRSYALTAVFSPHSDRLGAIPYTRECFAALGIEILRAIHALTAPPFKVIAVDCDDSLWEGLCGERAPADLVLESGHLFLQQFLKEQQRRGMLLCLLSKNNEPDVRRVFTDRAADMPLAWSDLSATRINWESKASNLVSIAGELGLGLDRFVFVDDSRFECEQMRDTLPEVLTICLPDSVVARKGTMLRAWCFDTVKVTGEDRARAGFYSEDRSRRALRADAASVTDFIRQLELQLRFERLGPEMAARCAQLTQRTTQFNVSTIRREEAGLLALGRDGRMECWVVHARDRFGDYGWTGLLIAAVDGGTLRVDTFVLSCRVLGRGVEHRMLSRLRDLAVSRQCGTLAFTFRATARNQPARLFLEALGTPDDRHDDGPAGFTLIVSLDRIAGFLARPVAEAPERPADAGSAVARAPVTSDPAVALEPARRARALERIIEVTATAADVLAASVDLRSKGPAAGVSDIPPELSSICRAFADALNLVAVGPDESFWALGGTSLEAAIALGQLPQYDMADLVGVSTPRQLLQLGDHKMSRSGRFIELLPDERTDARSIMVLFPAMGGNPFTTMLFADLLRDVFPGRILGVKDPMLFRDRFRSLPEAGEAIAQELLSEHAFERCILGGGSMGAVLAFEVAGALERRGRPPSLTWMIDPPVQPHAVRQRMATRMAHLQAELAVGPRSVWKHVPRIFRTIVIMDRSGTGPQRFRRLLRWADPSWRPAPAASRPPTREEVFSDFIGHVERTASPDEIEWFRALGIPRIQDLGFGTGLRYACAGWNAQARYRPRRRLSSPVFLVWDRRTVGAGTWRELMARGEDTCVEWIAHGSATPHMYLASPENTQKYRQALRARVSAGIDRSAEAAPDAEPVRVGSPVGPIAARRLHED